MYSPEQGLKIQISDFYKSLFDGNSSQILIVEKETMYQEVLGSFLDFFKILIDSIAPEGELDFSNPLDRRTKSLEYSAYLML